MSEQPLGTVVSCPGLDFIGLLPVLAELVAAGRCGTAVEHIVDHIVSVRQRQLA